MLSPLVYINGYLNIYSNPILVATDIIVRITDLRKRQKMNIIDKLNDFINQTKESKEIKRALAVKMTLSGKSYHEVKELLNVSHSFISEWKNQALFHGVESLRLQYQGRQGYLKTVEKEKTIEWLRAQDYLRLSDLKNYLQEQYDVVFESNQSYYNLFK